MQHKRHSVVLSFHTKRDTKCVPIYWRYSLQQVSIKHQDFYKKKVEYHINNRQIHPIVSAMYFKYFIKKFIYTPF